MLFVRVVARKSFIFSKVRLVVFTGFRVKDGLSVYYLEFPVLPRLSVESLSNKGVTCDVGSESVYRGLQRVNIGRAKTTPKWITSVV